MHRKIPNQWFLLLALLAMLFYPGKAANAASVSAGDLIMAMNSLRISYGLPALVEDPIIDAVAQSTAQIMAANQMSSHVGNVPGRLAAAGYGGGVKVWATENFAIGNLSLDQIMQIWSDESHMLPAVIPAYCNVGAGVAKAGNGMTYYILQAAYTESKSCGEYKAGGKSTGSGSASPSNGVAIGVPQIIIPVKIATPDADGRIFHVVEAGQSFWAIAIAYKITIKDLQTWNNLGTNSRLQIGQRLFIPGSNTVGYSTPTPVGFVITSTPDQNGKIVHVVQAYQTLSTIAQAYGIKVDTILNLNYLQVDWPLQIGQKLVIQPSSVTPSPTPRPLTPLQKLTPASDGKYYHIVSSGETLSYIARLYEVKVTDLMAWNGLDNSSIIQPKQKLLLQVTPPATQTPTPAPATATLPATPTATATPTQPTPTPTLTPVPTQTVASPTAAAGPPSAQGNTPIAGILSIILGAGGLLLVFFLFRRKPGPPASAEDLLKEK